MKEKELTKLLTIQRSEPGVDKGRQWWYRKWRIIKDLSAW
jgi:hypothetical protein